MRFIRLILAVALMAGMPMIARCADKVEAPAADSTHAVVAAAQEHAGEAKAGPEKEEGVSLKPIEIWHIGKLPITNSMLVTWIVAIVIIVFARIATRNIKEVPMGAQNFWEWLVESLYNFLRDLIGSDLVRRTFWFFATIFILILACNWFGLIPGVGTIGYGHKAPDGGFVVDQPLFRGANADLNMTFAMSMVFFACWLYWAITSNGVGGFLGHIFGVKGNTAGFMKVLMVIVFFCVGILEVISILFRPVSLSFRLFGNVYAGESMLEAMSHIVPKLGWLIPIPFYFMELLVGLVQALVFMLLTAVFTLLIASHADDHDAAHPHH
ncbi:F0F1 ATP synthase subunit A [Pedosphaera parvula]|uniref:ATP synthase subunit a n=1 Tax=Pedosphaera parvula (strain Ellin514) TaxID=320771 RepID=B9XPF3_PEDPL|nr:F0F1 ATP synthase subunit A [Pedosphaera parvula]EEF58293.1 ATP synthase F0, A subunit [Pedosphaera parvula Ellin514]